MNLYNSFIFNFEYSLERKESSISAKPKSFSIREEGFRMRALKKFMTASGYITYYVW